MYYISYFHLNIGFYNLYSTTVEKMEMLLITVLAGINYIFKVTNHCIPNK